MIWQYIAVLIIGWLAAEALAPKPPSQRGRGNELTKAATNEFLKKFYGKVEKTNGTIIFKATTDNDNDDQPNDLLHMVIVWGYAVESIDEVYFDDIPVSSNNELFFWEGTRIAHALNFPNGMQGYDDPQLRAAGWEETDEAKGCACTYVRLEYLGAEKTLNTEPEITADVTGTTSSNAMVALNDYVTSDIYGKGADSSTLDVTRLTAEAGIADSQVETYPGSGEYRSLFTFNEGLSGEDTVLENINKILKSCRAMLPILDGKLTPIIEKDDDPVPVEILEEDILELGKITNSNKNNRFNRVIVEYYSPSANATLQEAFYPDKDSAEETAWLAEDNGILLEKSIKLHSCRDYYEAYAYAKTFAEVSRQQLRTTLTLPAWATIFEVGDIVNVSHTKPVWTQKPFRIESTEEITDDDEDFVKLSIREHQPAVYVQPGESQPPEIPDTGAPGGGVIVTPGTEYDSTESISEKIQALIDTGAGGKLTLAQGDYYITNTLPMGSNITICGAGMPAYRTYWLNVTSAQNVNGRALLNIFDQLGTGALTHRIMSGDVVKIDGSNDSKLNGVKEVYSVDPSNSTITLTSSATTNDTTTVGGNIRLSILIGGTIIRFQNHLTGNVTTNKRFFDCEDARNVCLYDIGFVGPGINAPYGGGMRFRRVRELDGRSRAITGYHWNNVFLNHVADDGIRFDQLIHSYLGHFNINRCVGDGILFQAGPEGGTTTSVHIDTPYIQNCRRGIAFYTAAYCTLTNPVVEGTSMGYYVNRGIGMTFDSMASETIKFDSAGQAGGVTGLFVNSYGCTINSPTVYYNTEERAWTKAALVFVDPSKRVESPTAVINGGHIHWSLGQKIKIIGKRASGGTKEGRIYLDVSQDEGYIPPDGATGSSWIGNSFWDDSIQIKIIGSDTSIFNDRFRVNDIQRIDWISAGATIETRPPDENDDAAAGFAEFTSYWQNTNEGSREGRYVCIDDTNGAAKWARTEETYQIDFDLRDELTMSKRPDSSQAYAIRLGRNYGVDVATDNIQRVLGTSSFSNGWFIAYLDITHLHPTRFPMKVNYDPYTLNSTNEYIVKSQEMVTIDAINYVLVELIVGNDGWDNGDPQDSPHRDIIEDALNADGDPIEVKFSDNGVETITIPAKMKLDAATQNLFLYFNENSYIDVGDTFTVYNAMLSEMDGKWTVDSKDIREQEGLPCIEVVCSDTVLRSGIEYSVDDAVYVMDKWSAPVSNQIAMDGLDTLYVYDEAEAIAVPPSRQGTGLAVSGTGSTTINIPAASNYDYEAYFVGALERITFLSSDFTSVQFLHDPLTTNLTFKWKATRKKSPGVEAIYDRN